MAKRRVALKGRTIVAISLGTFLLVTSSVVMRRSRGTAAARQLHALGQRHAELEAQRAQLVADVQRASSREQLATHAQRLGLRVPSDSQVILLPRPEPRQR